MQLLNNISRLLVYVISLKRKLEDEMRDEFLPRKMKMSLREIV